MKKNDNKSLIIYNQPKKGLIVPRKRDVLKIGLSIDESDKKDYLKTRIKELEDSNRKLKDAINSLSDRKDELKYLREFRDMFSGYCISGLTRLTIIQCANRIKRGHCNMNVKCKVRENILKLIGVENQ